MRGLAVTPDGDTFLSAGEDGMVKQWDLTVASDLGQVSRAYYIHLCDSWHIHLCVCLLHGMR